MSKLIKYVGFLLSFFILIFIFVIPPKAIAQTNNLNVYFFWGEGCPHCANEKEYLEKLKDKYPEMSVKSYEVWDDIQNRELLIKIGKKLKSDIAGVPFTVIGEKVFVGFSETLYGEEFEKEINNCLTKGCIDPVADKVKNLDNEKGVIPEKINVPVLGEIKTKNLSLPLFTIVLGAIDGFNPCAMWTLLFLIGLLLGLKDKKRRWILGTVFITTSAVVYFLFMSAWLNLLLFIGFIAIIRIIIALVAVIAGIYNIREFFTNKDASCKVTNSEKRQQVFQKLKNITLQESFILSLVGIIALAFAVNLVELICSAGLPVIFTQVLTLSGLAKWQYYAYMFLYILVFMLDDLFVFFTAMVTLEISGVSTKYGRISKLVGGIIVFAVGIILLLKPEILMFG